MYCVYRRVADLYRCVKFELNDNYQLLTFMTEISTLKINE